ncbi:MAG: molybdopterin converting factor subunit 1 [Gammaproteobacteria bacterium]|nr:molybdopterin converting factor subunit 1 [Gammaproteobacteria bacterium]|tara:strand:- start:935 stop:1186 length:252 start_codon:yes stop_codon:yes gene_type:complete
MIEVVFFASLCEELGSDSVSMDASGITDVGEVIDKLAQEKGARWSELLMRENILVAVNQQMVDQKAAVVDKDEVAFFPPVTGG